MQIFEHLLSDPTCPHRGKFGECCCPDHGDNAPKYDWQSENLDAYDHRIGTSLRDYREQLEAKW